MTYETLLKSQGIILGSFWGQLGFFQIGKIFIFNKITNVKYLKLDEKSKYPKKTNFETYVDLQCIGADTM
jgi:hypothetical protein